MPKKALLVPSEGRDLSDSQCFKAGLGPAGQAGPTFWTKPREVGKNAGNGGRYCVTAGPDTIRFRFGPHATALTETMNSSSSDRSHENKSIASDGDKTKAASRGLQTRLIHSAADAPPGFRSLSTPIYHGSTTVFDTLAEAYQGWRPGGPYTYGIYGTPTTLKLGARVAEIEKAKYAFIVPSGQAAIALIYLVYARSGSHILMTESAYGNSREIADDLLAELNVEVESYDPMIGGGIAKLIRPNTHLIWTESPGSITMEVQDIPAIVAAARPHKVPVAIDNTYAAGVLFDAFEHGVDVSMQALTKYVGGHSDLLLGSVSVRDEATMRQVGKIYRLLGMAVSPDDCGQALAGCRPWECGSSTSNSRRLRLRNG